MGVKIPRLFTRSPIRPVQNMLAHGVIGFDRSDAILKALAAQGHPVRREGFSVRCDDQIVYWNLLVAGAGLGFAQVLLAGGLPGSSKSTSTCACRFCSSCTRRSAPVRASVAWPISWASLNSASGQRDGTGFCEGPSKRCASRAFAPYCSNRGSVDIPSRPLQGMLGAPSRFGLEVRVEASGRLALTRAGL